MSDKEKLTAQLIMKIGNILRRKKLVYFIKVGGKDKSLGDFSFIRPFDVLNCNKQSLSVLWSSNMRCRFIVRLWFNSNLNHSLFSLRKIYLWNHRAVIVLCFMEAKAKIESMSSFFLPHQPPVVFTNRKVFLPSLSDSFIQQYRAFG